MTAVLSLTGLGQVLEFMYTAKLHLSPENVDDVLAVASFLQMQDIITACHTLKSLAEPSSTTGESADVSAVEGEVIGRPLLKMASGAPASVWLTSRGLRSLIYLASVVGVLVRMASTSGKGPHARPFLILGSRGQEPHMGHSVRRVFCGCPFRSSLGVLRCPQKPIESYHGSGQGSSPLLSTSHTQCLLPSCAVEAAGL